MPQSLQYYGSLSTPRTSTLVFSCFGICVNAKQFFNVFWVSWNVELFLINILTGLSIPCNIDYCNFSLKVSNNEDPPALSKFASFFIGFHDVWFRKYSANTNNYSICICCSCKNVISMEHKIRNMLHKLTISQFHMLLEYL